MDLETKKHIRQQGARDDFTKMKKCIEQLRQMEKSLTNNKMDIGYVAEAAENHSEFVAWQDAGCPEWGAEGEWSEDAAQGDWSEDAGQLAAMGGKSKGKGKGKTGKGKGKGKDGGKGKGKGKGKDGGKGNGGTSAATSPTGGKGADDRMCYNCCEYGHIGKDCPIPDRRKAARSLEAAAHEAPGLPAQQLKPMTLATAISRVGSHPIRSTMRLCPLWTRVGNSKPDIWFPRDILVR